MKLPQVTYGQVQPMGRHDTGAVAAEASAVAQQGEALQRSANMIAEVAADYMERKENAEYDDQVAERTIAISKWKEKYDAKTFITSDELEDLPEDLVPRTEGIVNKEGFIDTAPRESIPAHEWYPHMLKRHLEKTTKVQADKISNPNLRNAFINKAKIDNADMVMKATVAAEAAQQKYLNQKYAMSAEEAAQSGNLELAHYYIERLDVDENKKKELRAAADFENEVFEITQAIRSTDQETVLAMRSMLDDENYNGELNEKQRQAMIGDLSARINQLSAEREAEKKRIQSEYFNGLAVGIIDGDPNVNRMAIDAARDRYKADPDDPNGITHSQHTQLVGQLRASQSRSRTDADYAQIIADMESGRVHGDVSNRDHVKAVNWYVGEMGLVPENVQALSQLAENSGIIPQMLKSQINGKIMTDNPDENAIGFQMFANFRERRPHLLDQLGPSAKKVGTLAYTLYDSGLSPKDAMAEAYKRNLELTEQDEKMYEEQWNDMDYDREDWADALTDHMDDDDRFDQNWLPGSDVDPDPRMLQRYMTLTKHYLAMSHGDLHVARSSAYEAVRSEWGKTAAGKERVSDEGDRGQVARVMRYPPEEMLGLDTHSVNGALKLYADANDLDVDNIIIGSNFDTPKTFEWPIFIDNPDTGEITLAPPFKGQKWAGQYVDTRRAEAAESATDRRAVKEATDEQRKAIGDEMF